MWSRKNEKYLNYQTGKNKFLRYKYFKQQTKYRLSLLSKSQIGICFTQKTAISLKFLFEILNGYVDALNIFYWINFYTISVIYTRKDYLTIVKLAVYVNLNYMHISLPWIEGYVCYLTPFRLFIIFNQSRRVMENPHNMNTWF